LGNEGNVGEIEGAVLCWRSASGVRDSISVARPWAASSVGRSKGPFWPQPSKATVQSARLNRVTNRVTKIKQTFNICSIVMTDLEFLDHAELLLLAVEQGCDRLNDETEADIDNQRTGGMITLSFANRSQIIVNLQKPLHEVWMAAKSGGYHYRFVDGAWQDTKGQGEFFANLSRYASEQTGLSLVFKAS
jgi:CyaY protein